MIASNKIKYNFFWKLLFLIVSPSLAYVLFNLSSLSVGLVLVSAVILLFNNFEIYIKDIKGLPLIVVHVFFGFEFIKTIYLGLSMLTLVQIYLSLIIIILISQNLVHNAVTINFRANYKYVAYVLILILLINIFNIQIGNYNLFEKAVFPFSEPSHLALTFGYFLPTVFYMQKNRIVKFSLFIIFLFFGFFYESLIFVFVILTSYFIASKVGLKILFSISLVVLFLILIEVNYDIINTDYYSSRLNFQNSDNISVLVFLQGWEIIMTTLNDYNLIGVGLNNLETFPNGPVSESIYAILGEYKNRQGGGFLASKIIGETGVLGIVTIIIYVKFVFLKFKNIAKKKSLLNFFYSSVLFISLFELFFRGMGYFTIGTILTTSSLIYFKTND